MNEEKRTKDSVLFHLLAGRGTLGTFRGGSLIGNGEAWRGRVVSAGEGRRRRREGRKRRDEERTGNARPKEKTHKEEGGGDGEQPTSLGGFTEKNRKKGREREQERKTGERLGPEGKRA